MNFNKKAAVVAVAAASLGFAGNAVAEEATVTPYGKINITVQQTDDGSLDGMELKSNASRFGLKGKAKLSDSLKAIYKLEWKVDPTDEKDTKDNHIKARNQFVGLAGGFGEIIAGRSDTPLKKAQGKVDLFNDLEADIKHIFEGEVRADNILQYTTPKFAGGLKIKLAATTPDPEKSELVDHDNDPNTPDVLQTTQFGDATSIAIEYATKSLFVALAQDNDVSGSDTKTTRLTTQYKLDNWSFGLIYNEHDNGTIDEEGLLASIAYKSGNHTFKLQAGESDEKKIDAEQMSLGYDYKLGKQTKIFFFHTSYDNKDGSDDSWLGFGLEQKF